MIHKVNRPELQLIVSSPKAAENDPGSSQGGGVAYEKLPDPGSDPHADSGDPEAQAPDQGEGDGLKPGDSQGIPPSEQIGLGEVLREFKESHKCALVRPGLAVQYQSEGGSAKGLLLNKKVE